MRNLSVSLSATLFVIFSTVPGLSEMKAASEGDRTLQNNLAVLYEMCAPLIGAQIADAEEENFGAIQCRCCNALHTRAAEAVYPLAAAYKHSGKEKYRSAALALGDWLVSQQIILWEKQQGFWYETPGRWNGPTTFQLLSLVAAYPILKQHLSAESQEKWELAITRAANWSVSGMSESFANINYLATTSASLVFADEVVGKPEYLAKAKELAHIVINKINEDGFLVGEGHCEQGQRYGTDLAYNLDMSLGALALYSLLTKDDVVKDATVKALQTHLYFMYPEGSVDDSWGSRSYKWTTYGSKTAHGCQMAFAPLSGEDPRFETAAQLNLIYLGKMMKDGWVGYGPHSWNNPAFFPCIYPTFTRATNLAFAIEYGNYEVTTSSPIPSQKKNWFAFFPTINVALVRTENLMATITANPYNYGDKHKRERTIPTGGCISNLWSKGYGFLQTSSQTVYERREKMHMPIEEALLPLTARIECYEDENYYTNLYETNCKISIENESDAIAEVGCKGELKSRDFQTCGIEYSLTYKFFADKVVKRLRLHSSSPKKVTVVEPIVKNRGVKFIQKDARTILIKAKEKTLKFKILSPGAELLLGVDEDRYWYPFPSLRCCPISIVLDTPTEIVYEIGE